MIRINGKKMNDYRRMAERMSFEGRSEFMLDLFAVFKAHPVVSLPLVAVSFFAWDFFCVVFNVPLWLHIVGGAVFIFWGYKRVMRYLALKKSLSWFLDNIYKVESEK